MQEVPLSSPLWPIDTSSMSTSSNLLAVLLLVQLFLYGYLLLLESLRPQPSATTNVTPSSTVSQLDCTDATNEQLEATSSEASGPDEDAEDQLIEPGHAFLDKMAQLVPANLAGSCQAPPS